MIDLRNRFLESEDDVYVLVYKGPEDKAKKAADAIGRKLNDHKGNVWYFRYPTEKDARAAWAKSDKKSFEGKFEYKKITWKEWKEIQWSITGTKESINKESVNMIDLREKKAAKHEDDGIKFVNKGEKFKSEKGDEVEIVDIDKGDSKTTVTYKLGSKEKKGDIEDVIKMLNGAEYKKVDDKKGNEKKESSVYIKTTDDILDFYLDAWAADVVADPDDLKAAFEAGVEGKVFPKYLKGGEDFDYIELAYNIGKDVRKMGVDKYAKQEIYPYLDEAKKEACVKKEADLPDSEYEAWLNQLMEIYCALNDIKFDKNDVEKYLKDKKALGLLVSTISHTRKKYRASYIQYLNDKYDLGIDAKQFESCAKKEDDGEDSKEEPADDKKDEKKSKKEADADTDDVEEKKAKKKEDDAEDSDAEGDAAEKQDESVEVTLTEDFHVPGTDIVLEKGDVIKIIPKQD